MDGSKYFKISSGKRGGKGEEDSRKEQTKKKGHYGKDRNMQSLVSTNLNLNGKSSKVLRPALQF